MAKNNKLPPKNAAAKAVPSKPKPTKVAAKSPTKASPVSNSVKSVKSSGATARPSASAAKPAPKSPPAKSAGKAPAKPAPQKAVMAKAAAKPQPGKPPAKAAATPPPAAQPQQRAMPANGAKVAAERLSSPARPTQQARPAPQARPAQELRPGHQVRPAHQVRPVPAPSTPAAKPVQAAPKPVAAPAAEAGPKKPVTSRHGFRTNELIVYPAHGVGRIVGIEEQEIAGISLELFVIEFEKDKMTLRVPTTKLMNVGMRKLAEDGVLKKALETLKGKARIKRTMWSRRAQEYEAKINSGDLVAIAEVVRDLYRSEAQPEQSYSERQLYEAALDRMSRELAAVDKSDERSAMQRITEILAKSAKGRRAVEEEAQANAGDEGEVKAA